MDTKTCSKCGIERNLSDFNRKSTMDNSPRTYCRSCGYKGPRKRSEKQLQWYNENRQAIREENRRNHLLRKFGITEEEYATLLKKQNGVCASCKNKEVIVSHQNGNILPLSIDHDHSTGKIRGLLCGSCNRALGLLKDSIKNIENLLGYLKDSENL